MLVREEPPSSPRQRERDDGWGTTSNRATSKRGKNPCLQESGRPLAPWLRADVRAVPGAEAGRVAASSGEEGGVRRLSDGGAAADSERQLLSLV